MFVKFCRNVCKRATIGTDTAKNEDLQIWQMLPEISAKFCKTKFRKMQFSLRTSKCIVALKNAFWPQTETETSIGTSCPQRRNSLMVSPRSDPSLNCNWVRTAQPDFGMDEYFDTRMREEETK